MDASEKSVYEIIGDYPIHIDQIVRLSDRDAGEILAVLTRLELKGIITQLPGKMFVR
jgi:DNA processing protein